MKSTIKLAAVLMLAIGLAGCASTGTTGTPSTQPATLMRPTPAQLNQQLQIARGIVHELGVAGVLTADEIAIADGVYSAASAALSQYATDLAAGDQPSADLALAAAQGYLANLGQTTVRGKTRRARGKPPLPSTQPISGPQREAGAGFFIRS